MRGVIMFSTHFMSAVWFGILAIVLAALPIDSAMGQADDAPAASGENSVVPLADDPNVVHKTLGGMQFWGDALVFYGWRIQRHVITGHYRLLDDQDVRRAWGGFAECHEALHRVCRDRQLKPVRGNVVVLLHGLARTRGSMDGLGAYLAEHSKYVPINVGYASTRAAVDVHARALMRVLEHLPEADRIDLVAHSLGNIVVRRYFALAAEEKGGQRTAGRIGRVVMLCPPNHGAFAASQLSAVDFSKHLAGPAIRQLGVDWKQFRQTLARPSCPFGILAGGLGDDEGYNPLVPGDDDMVISVATTRLEGAADFHVVPAMHTFFMDDPSVRKFVQHFLQHGSFDGN